MSHFKIAVLVNISFTSIVLIPINRFFTNGLGTLTHFKVLKTLVKDRGKALLLILYMVIVEN